MGLRINTNLPSLVALRNLNITDLRQQKNLERLSTGLKLNRPSDDPFGMTLSETLRTQIRALRQASDNAQNAGNLVTTAESSLSKISDLLHDIRGSVLAALNGTSTNAQIAAEQDAVDSALRAIERIAATTRFGGVPLLNGQGGFSVENLTASGILEVRPERVNFNPTTSATSFTIEVTSSAAQATLSPGAVSGGSVTLRIDGPKGTVSLQLVSGTTALAVAGAIDSMRGFTGIYASGSNLFTESFGSQAHMRIEILAGDGTLGTSGVGSVLWDTGSNVVARFQGAQVTGLGRTLSITNPYFSGEVEMMAGASGTYSFDIRRSGLIFQLGIETSSIHQETIGIQDMSPVSLGQRAFSVGGEETGGFLNTLESGQANDLFNNPDNAIRILDLALEDVSRARSSLGAFLANIVEPSEQFNEVAIENLSAADSTLRDADFAEEVAELTRNQIIFQSGIAVLGQAQTIPQSVLQLLTG